MRIKHWFYTMPLRLRSLFRRSQVEQELDEELRYHIERQIEENIAKGMSEEEARYAALRAMGGVEQRKEECRDTRGVRLIEELMQDLRYGLRMLRKSPGFTAVAALSLALGIGANTAIFSLVDPILIRLLPVKNPEQLVALKTVNDRGEEHSDHFSYSMFERLRDRTQVFSGVFANACGDCTVNMVGPEHGNQSEKARLNLVSGEYFQVLGVNAVLGRTLTTADNQAPGAHPVAVVSYRFWQRRFAGDASVIGKVIKLKNQPFTIIGVTAPEFFGAEVGRAPDIWAPLMMMNFVLEGRSGVSFMDDMGLRIMARLLPGVREEQAQAALDIFWEQIKSEPGGLTGERSNIKLSPGRQGFAWVRAQMSQPLLIMMAVVGLVLLIACANVANLLLARAARRAPEVAIRLTIGAGRFRLVRQFLTESALLTAAGAFLGLLFAWWSRDIILALISEYGYSIPDGSIGAIPNVRVFGFTIAVSALTTLLFGLAPALIATRHDLNAALKSPAPPLMRRSRLSLSRSLVIAQVALSLLLLTGAGLFIQTLRNLRTRDIGFAAERIIQGRIFAEDAGYMKDQLPGLYNRILERLNSAPGIRSGAMSHTGFLYNHWATCCIAVEGYTHRPDEDRQIQINGVSPGYFQTLELPLLLGRDFTPQDISGQPGKSPKGDPFFYQNVAIINETMARHYFGTANPLGRRIGWANPEKENDNLYTSSQLLDENLFLERLLAKLSGFFSLLALLLSCVGLYGVMSYDVARRTHEIGIRMALGAQRIDVVGLVLRETMSLVVIGVIIGLGAAMGATRLITSFLYGLEPNDPLTIALASLAMLTVAALAGYLPARRASRVDPMVALRHD